MTNTPSIKKNYVYSLIYQILTMITPFITAPYVARVLGADGVGTCSYTQSYMTYFTMAAALGTSSYGMREIAQCRDNKAEYSKKFWEIELLTVCTTTICIVAWILLCIFSSQYKIYFAVLTPSLLAVLFDISWFYNAHEQFNKTVSVNIIFKIVGIACIFIFINDKNDLPIYMLLGSVIGMLGSLSMWIFLPRMLVRVDMHLLEFRKHFRETLIYFIPTIATTIYTVLDKTLIGVITHDAYQNGYYEQATKIVNMGKSLTFVSVNTVMSARISYLFSENKIEEIKARIEKSMNFILLFGFAVCFGIIAIAKDFVPVFFGPGYEPVTELFYWMSPLILIISISNCLGSQYYTPAGLRSQSSKYIITGAGINLVMNLILIPAFGTIGAVAGSIVAEVTISLLYLIKCGGYLTAKQVLLCSYKRLVAGAVMIVAVKIVSQCGLVGISLLLCEVFAGAAVYFLVLYLFRDNMLSEAFSLIKSKVLRNG